MATFYQAERFNLQPAALGRVGAFSGIVALLIQSFGISLLVRRYAEYKVGRGLDT
jgi:hypothetical protein